MHHPQQQKGTSMEDRRLDTSLHANNAVALKRIAFDKHLNTCKDCQPHLCHRAEILWRDVCLTALRTQGTPGALSDATRLGD